MFEWARQDADRIRSRVADHVAWRDADPAERKRIETRRQAELAQIASNIRGNGLNVASPQPLPLDNTYQELAALARQLMVENFRTPFAPASPRSPTHWPA